VREIGPPLTKAVQDGLAAGERLFAMVVEPAAGQPSPLSFAARILAREHAVMSTADLARD